MEDSGRLVEKKTRQFTFKCGYDLESVGYMELKVVYDAKFVRYSDSRYVYVYISCSAGKELRYRSSHDAIHWTALFEAYKKCRKNFFDHCDDWVQMDLQDDSNVCESLGSFGDGDSVIPV